MISIDIIIPSYRLLSKYLVPALQMDIPEGAKVRYLVIADNPQLAVPPDLEPFIDNEKVLLIRNSENLGVCKTRNIGIDNATGDWILFLDDDVKPSSGLLVSYIRAIEENPGATGFFGDVIFPKPKNSFTNAIRICGILSVFTVNETDNKRKWTPTANVIVNRAKIGAIRFNEVFAKKGAGEEIDFFLQIEKKTNGELRGIKNAEVYHNWWYNGKRILTRFYRWNTGVGLLPSMYPEYAFYNFPNMIECIVLFTPLLIILSLLLHTYMLLVCFFSALIIGEIAVEWLRIVFTRSLMQGFFALDVVLIRMANDLGRFASLFNKSFRLKGLLQRFDVSCSGKSVKQQRLWAGMKFASYILLSVLFYFITH